MLQNPLSLFIQRFSYSPTVSARLSLFCFKFFSNSSLNQAKLNRTNRGDRRRLALVGTPGNTLKRVFPSLNSTASQNGEFKDEFHLQRKPSKKISSENSIPDVVSSAENPLKKKQEGLVQTSNKRKKLELLSQKRNSQVCTKRQPSGTRKKEEFFYEKEERHIVKDGDIEQFSADYMPREDETVLVVNTVDVAKSVVEKLCTELKDEVHACDTEVRHYISLKD